MAEAGGIVQSVLASAASAAELSLALFNVAQTLDNAPNEVPEIAEGLSMFAEGLQTLADVINDNQGLCKPALFQSTHAILGRYDQVEAELKLLIETPEGLDNLRWYIKEPQVKSLLKKVEAIKTVLVLESNIIRLAREESNRPYAPSFAESTVTTSSSTSNRYRVVVESAVQANRQVVQSAQRDNAQRGAWQQDNFGKELKVWKKDSFDTATWLYHLVFDIDTTESTEQRPPPVDFEASARPVAADLNPFSSEGPRKSTRNSAISADKAPIQWGQNTEPSSVVDRLLHAWTTLSPERITSSSKRDEHDNWRVQHLQMIQDLRKEESRDDVPARSSSASGSKQVPKSVTVEEYFSSGEDQYVEPRGPDFFNDKPVPKFQPELYGEVYTSELDDYDDEWESLDKSAKPKKKAVKWPPDPVPNPGRRSPASQRRTKPRESVPKKSTKKRDESQVPSYGSSNKTYYTYDPSSETPQWPPWAPPLGVPPLPDYSIPSHANLPTPHFSSYPSVPSMQPYNNPFDFPSAPPMQPYNPFAFPGPYPPIVPSPPPMPSTNKSSQYHETSQDHDTSSMKNSKEAAVITMLESLLEKHGKDSKAAEDTRLSKLVQILEERQEMEKQDAEKSSRSLMEAQFRHIQAAGEEQEKKLKELQEFISQQEKAQRRAEAEWTAERASLGEKAAKESKEAKEAREKAAMDLKDAAEVREYAAREIAEAKSAKKAARKSLKLAKAEAEKQANSEIEIKVAAELTRVGLEHKKQMEVFQEQLRAIQTQQSVPELSALNPASPRPIRRTCISDKNRSVDVFEYATNNVGRSMLQPFSPFKFVQEELFRNDMDAERRTGRSQSQHSRLDSFFSSTQSVASESTSTASAVSKPQQLIVLPSKINRTSAEIHEMQSSLADSGVDSMFEDIDSDNGKQLVKYDETQEQVVRSTVFWEPPILTLGSELLLTLRKAGWQPIYTRTSDDGHTHFLGNQPVHSYFFRPNYKPQFLPASKPSPSNTIIIHKALVEEYALQELGFEFNSTDLGTYILDGRLTFNDIEALIERSFLMRENNYRRLHRQLQRHYTRAPATSKVSKPQYEDDYAESPVDSSSSASVVHSCTTCHDRDSDADDRSTIDPASFNRREREQYLVPETGDPRDAEQDSDGRDSSGDETISVTRSTRVSPVPPSTASKSSVSTNPYHRFMTGSQETERSGDGRRVPRTVWDELEDLEDRER